MQKTLKKKEKLILEYENDLVVMNQENEALKQELEYEKTQHKITRGKEKKINHELISS